MGAKNSKKKNKKSIGSLKVLILGNSGSGKSTFSKQMKFIHGGYTKEEILQYRVILQQNIILGLQELIKYTDSTGPECIANENRKKVRYINELTSWTIHWDEALCTKVKQVWQDSAIRSTWDTYSPILPLTVPNLNYLMEHIDRITDADFMPSVEDVLLARQRTTGCFNTSFTTKDNYVWNLVDVGGQKPERAKWDSIMKSDEFNAVIFIVALDEYNVIYEEEKDITKLQFAMRLFKEVIENLILGDYKDHTVILFFNKIDVFQKKIESDGSFQDFKKSFPNYNGPRSVENCSEHIYNIFMESCEEIDGFNQDWEIHYHNTCALDTSVMTNVFEAVMKDLYVQRLQTCGTNII